jgi:hypothetical protein
MPRAVECIDHCSTYTVLNEAQHRVLLRPHDGKHPTSLVPMPEQCLSARTSRLLAAATAARGVSLLPCPYIYSADIRFEMRGCLFRIIDASRRVFYWEAGWRCGSAAWGGEPVTSERYIFGSKPPILLI